MKQKTAVIGGGMSGLATAQILKKNGFEAVVFEKAEEPGGVWEGAYPGVHLQNLYSHYYFSDFPWPFQPDFHPSGAQLMQYIRQAVTHFELDVRTGHEVVSIGEENGGWRLHYRHEIRETSDWFDYVVIATGQFTQRKVRPEFPGESLFQGRVMTELDLRDTAEFDGKRVVVVGFGKSALDMCSFAAPRAETVQHVFRSPHWMLSEHILGVHFTYALFSRFGLVMMPCWAYPSAFERFLHGRLSFLVNGFWKMVAGRLKRELLKHGKGKNEAAQKRLLTLLPKHDLLPDIGAKTALAPENYGPYVVEGRIIPHHTEITGFYADGVFCKDGYRIPADVVLLCLGNHSPQFPYLPQRYRDILEKENDGCQLYRHMIHPRIPRLAFSGFNHGFMHMPTTEISTQWLCAVLRGELQLPSVEKMEQDMARTAAWKRAHMQFEPVRLYGINTRFQQYIDMMLKEIGVSAYRKMPNFLAEVFGRYEARDYKGVSEEYLRKKRAMPLKTKEWDM